MATQNKLLLEAVRLVERGAYPEAISAFRQALAKQPQHFNTKLELAKACLDWGLIQTQKPLVEIDPNSLPAGALYYLQQAESLLRVLVAERPSSHHAQAMLATIHLIYDRSEEALVCLQKAQSKDPLNPEILYNRAYALMGMERYAEAITLLVRLSILHPEHGMGWYTLGEAYHFMGQYELAVSAYRQAIKYLPDLPKSYMGLARAYREMGRQAERFVALREGLECFPQNQELNFTLAVAALSVKDWKTGWRYYVCRFTAGNRPPIPEGYAFPWQPGQPLKVCYDQGLGDQLFFLRFLPGLVAKGMVVHYVTKPKLLQLLSGHPEFAKLESVDRQEEAASDILVGDLPFVAGMESTADIPPPFRLVVDNNRAQTLKEALNASGPPPYLGVTWQGGEVKEPGPKRMWWSLHKEISPTTLGELARSWRGTVVVLQRVPKNEDMQAFSKALGRPFVDWSALNDDLPEMLAGLSLLDEYVGVSNTNMHMIAGIGKTARVLVPSPPEWRWMAEGEESPWFPGFRIYRQDQNKEWGLALKKLADELNEQWG